MNAGGEADALPEREALAALAAGDLDGALSLLMRAYGTPLYRYCFQVVGERELAEEAHQMTFVQAYESLRSFGGRSSLKTWLFGIARHRALDLLKMTRRRQKRFELPGELPEHSEAVPGAESELDAHDRKRALRRCLGELAPKIRAALALRFQAELSYDEMAELCQERAPALQMRVARALPVLKRCLEAQGMSS